MKPLSDEDPLAKRLAALPAVPLDPAVAEAVRLRARVELVTQTEAPLSRLSLVWSQTVLPGVLLASGAAYTWGAVQMIGAIFVSG